MQCTCLSPSCSCVLAACPHRRPHQVRLHLAAAGHPILGDTLYGAPPLHAAAATGGVSLLADSRPSLAPRILLHASRIAFPAPVRHARLEAEAPLPSDIAAYVDAATSLRADVVA